MLVDLLIGLPDDRPGGLVLSLTYGLVAGGVALALGGVYAVACARYPRSTIVVQAVSAIVRGVPVLLLVFVTSMLSTLSVRVAALLALILYSWSHSGEILRSFAVSFPQATDEQATVMGLSGPRRWVGLRMGWALTQSFRALVTHWLSLLKDTGALVVLGVAELTTVARSLSEGRFDQRGWLTVLVTAGGLYLVATLALLQILRHIALRLPCTEGGGSI